VKNLREQALGRPGGQQASTFELDVRTCATQWLESVSVWLDTHSLKSRFRSSAFVGWALDNEEIQRRDISVSKVQRGSDLVRSGASAALLTKRDPHCTIATNASVVELLSIPLQFGRLDTFLRVL
jgi:hypothetical protein